MNIRYLFSDRIYIRELKKKLERAMMTVLDFQSQRKWVFQRGGTITKSRWSNEVKTRGMMAEIWQ